MCENLVRQKGPVKGDMVILVDMVILEDMAIQVDMDIPDTGIIMPLIPVMAILDTRSPVVHSCLTPLCY